jgi:hypothetical protein
MNLQHTKLRNRLDIEQVEKLLFLQINEYLLHEKQAEPTVPEARLEALMEDEDAESARIYAAQSMEFSTLLNNLKSMDMKVYRSHRGLTGTRF